MIHDDHDDIYTVRFSYKGKEGTWRDLLDAFADERINESSRTFFTKEEADKFINEDGPLEFKCFHYQCTEHIGGLTNLGRTINACRRGIAHAECTDECIVGGYSR